MSGQGNRGRPAAGANAVDLFGNLLLQSPSMSAPRFNPTSTMTSCSVAADAASSSTSCCTELTSRIFAGRGSRHHGVWTKALRKRDGADTALLALRQVGGGLGGGVRAGGSPRADGGARGGGDGTGEPYQRSCRPSA